jgi:hypothetical protein
MSTQETMLDNFFAQSAEFKLRECSTEVDCPHVPGLGFHRLHGHCQTTVLGVS